MCGRARTDGRATRRIGAHGRGGRYVRIVPALDPVVAMTAGYCRDDRAAAFGPRSAISWTSCGRP